MLVLSDDDQRTLIYALRFKIAKYEEMEQDPGCSEDDANDLKNERGKLHGLLDRLEGDFRSRLGHRS